MQIYIITYIIIYNYSPRFCHSFPVCLQFWHYIRHIYEKHGVHLQPETKHHIIFMKVPMGAARLRISAFTVTNQ